MAAAVAGAAVVVAAANKLHETTADPLKMEGGCIWSSLHFLGCCKDIAPQRNGGRVRALDRETYIFHFPVQFLRYLIPAC